MIVLIEYRPDPRVLRIMDAIYREATRLGHEPKWWMGPYHDLKNKAKADLPFYADIVFVWNGTTLSYRPFLRRWRKAGVPVYFCELGWFPHGRSFQVDWQGVNAGASWSNQPISYIQKTPVVPKNDRDILVLLQHENDTQIRVYSPWFPDMAALLEHLARVTDRRIVVRRHPGFLPSAAVGGFVQRSPNHRWDDSSSLTDALRKYDIVATINSSGAVEALSRGKVVICFGEAVYRRHGAVLCFDTGRFPVRLNGLYREAQQATLRMITEHQWTVAELPDRLAAILPAPAGVGV